MSFLGFFGSPFKRRQAEDQQVKVKAEVEVAGEVEREREREEELGGGGSSLALISLNERSGKFEVNEDALKTLAKVEGDVAVVSVCGRSRQGKSYLLNVLLRTLFEEEEEESVAAESRESARVLREKFKTSGSTQPCTKGLYLWPEPLTGEKDGRKLSIFFVDSEGIDSYDQSSNYSAEIFSLAVLLSSVFVYNSMGGIDESALDKLSLVCELTRMIRNDSSGSNNKEEDASLSDEDVKEQLPSLIWLLRDFFLDFEDGSATDYLEKALEIAAETERCPTSASTSSSASSSTSGPSQRNSIRETIKTLFPQRECLALVRPHNDERKLRTLSKLQYSELRQEFKDGLETLNQMIFHQVRAKRVGGKHLNGSMLANLCELYVKAINEGAVPTIASAWEGVAESQCTRALNSATLSYQEALQAMEVKANELALERHHQAALREASATFDRVAAGSKAMREAYKNNLMSDLAKCFATYKNQRYLEAEIDCLRILNDAEARKSSFLENFSSAQQADFVKWIDNFVEHYLLEVEGLSKMDLICKFLVSCLEEVVSKCGEGEQVETLQRKLVELEANHAEDIVKKEAAMATLKEVLRADVTHVNILLKREQAKNKRLQIKVNALQQQLETSNQNVNYTSSIVEKWAQEAAAAAKTPPEKADDATTKSLCEKLRTKMSIQDITNVNQN